MRTRPPSLSHSLLSYMLTFVVVTIIAFGAIWIAREWQEFIETSTRLRAGYTESQKVLIKWEVDQAVSEIRYQNARAESRLRHTIKQRVDEAHAIALHLCEMYRGVTPDAEIQRLIKEALRPIRFNSGRGYYFIVGFDGIEQLFADKPEMEGKNLLDLQDTHGRYVIRDMIDIAKNSGEGFYRYTWSKPNTPGKDFPKIAFVKRFAPYDWLIGTGEYLDDVQADIQQEMLERLSSIRFGQEGYLFGSTYTGDPLFTNGNITVGTKNIWNVTDPNGVKIIQEQRKAAEQPEGGFIYYAWKRLTKPEPSAKVSFVKGIPEWHWMIGAGVYLDDIEAVILARREVVYRNIIFAFISIFGVLIVLSACMSFIASHLARKIQINFQTFITFFETSATSYVKIDERLLHFHEFKELARAANRMIQERNRMREARQNAEAQVRQLNEELELRVKQRTAELEAANKELNDFAYVVSHDLKAPLRGIGHIAHWLVEDYGDQFDEHGKEMIALLLNRMKRMDSLIDGILEYSRVGRMVGKETRIQLDALVQEVIISLAPPPSVQMRVVTPLPVILGDRTRVIQVFQNLLSNAMKFLETPEGNIEIGCDDAGDAWRFRVTDDGPGIDEKYFGKIFQIFQTLQARDEHESTGIGLALVKKIVEFSGGRVWVESTVGQGSAFFFTLPKHPNGHA